MSREAFVAAQGEPAGLVEPQPCNCREPDCVGWQMVEPTAFYDALVAWYRREGPHPSHMSGRQWLAYTDQR